MTGESIRNAAWRDAVAGSGCALGCAVGQSACARGAAPVTRTRTSTYASPLELLLSPDGARLYVLCQESEDVRVLDAASYARDQEHRSWPRAARNPLSPDGSRLFVTNSWDDTLSVIDTQHSGGDRHLAGGRGAFERGRGSRGQTALCRQSHLATIWPCSTRRPARKKSGCWPGAESSYLALSPDGTQLYATHVYPNPRRRTGSKTARRRVGDHGDRCCARRRLSIAFRCTRSPASFTWRFPPTDAWARRPSTTPRTLFLWRTSNTAGSLPIRSQSSAPTWASPSKFRSTSWSATPRSHSAWQSLLTSRASTSPAAARRCVTVIDVPRLLHFIRAHPRPAFVAGSFGQRQLCGRAHSRGLNPRGLTLSRDGRTLFVANRLDDTISVIDTRTNRVASTIKLGGPSTSRRCAAASRRFIPRAIRFRDRSAAPIATSIPRSTASMEPGARWLWPQHCGQQVARGRQGHRALQMDRHQSQHSHGMRAAHGKILLALGELRRSDACRSGRLHSQPSAAAQPLAAAKRRADAGAGARQGIFERSVDKFSKPIPESNRCSYCHSGPKGTNQKIFDVGTRKPTDNTGLFEIAAADQYRAHRALPARWLRATLEEIWTIYNPNDKHGRTNDLTKDELNDLIEYLRTR